MHDTSDTYKEILKLPYKVQNALLIGGTDEIRSLSDEELMGRNDMSGPGGAVFLGNNLETLKTSAGVFPDAEPSIGNCISGQINISILTPEQEIPRTARLVPFSRIYYGQKFSEWIPKGVYFLDTREKNHAYKGRTTLDLEGFDSMMRAEQLYTGTALTSPARDIDVVTEIAGRIYVPVDRRALAIMQKGFSIPISADYTYRETLGYIAAMYAGNFVMSETGKLLLIPLNRKGV